MNEKDYRERVTALSDRLNNAKKAHCYLTARARARDMAKIKSEYHGTSFQEEMKQIIEFYKLK